MSTKKGGLTDLEKAALLVKVGIASSLLAARKIYLQEISGAYDPRKSPEGKWSNTGWYGGPNSGGKEGYYGRNTIHRGSLSGQDFVVLEKKTEYMNNSNHSTNHDNNYPGGNCPCCGTRYYVFFSEGDDLDLRRVDHEVLKKLLESAPAHLPETLDMLREEWDRVEARKLEPKLERKPVEKTTDRW